MNHITTNDTKNKASADVDANLPYEHNTTDTAAASAAAQWITNDASNASQKNNADADAYASYIDYANIDTKISPPINLQLLMKHANKSYHDEKIVDLTAFLLIMILKRNFYYNILITCNIFFYSLKI